MQTPGAFLEVVIGANLERFALDPATVCKIGRGPQNTIVLADNQVSRNHAIVQCTQEGEYLLTDLGSRNGTFVNQRRVTCPVLLRRGDRVVVGSYEFVFHGGAEPEQEAPSEAGETVVEFAERLITVLVADIRDFTGLSRRLSEASLSEVISAFVRDSGAILNSKGAWGQKYIGDAVMAIWVHASGKPELPDMVAVFESALHLFDVASRMQARFGLDAPIRIGAGINTGLACVGNMGSEAAADYTALSDAVNLSFRLESATKEIGCDLAVGRTSFDFLRSHVAADDFFQAHTRELKGYREPQLVYGATLPSISALLDELRKKREERAAEVNATSAGQDA